MDASKSTRSAHRTSSMGSPARCVRAQDGATCAPWKSRRPRSANMDRSRSAKLGVAALLFVTIAGFYWKLTLTNQYEWMRGPDLAEQVLPWFEVQAREIHAGRLPLWDPYVWSG